MTPRLSLAVQCAPAELPAAKVRALLRESLPQGGEVAVRFVDEDEMRALGRTKPGGQACDVLSFSYEIPSADSSPLGDIAICAEAARAAARTRGIPAAEHLAHLVVHGALHLSGMRHDGAAAAAAMEDAEREILARFGIPDPYGSPSVRNVAARDVPPARGSKSERTEARQ